MIKEINFSEKSVFLSLFLVFFIDGLGISIIFPFFGDFFLDSRSSIILSDNTQTLRNTLYGLGFISFPLGMFLRAPLLGAFSDLWEYSLAYSFFLTMLSSRATPNSQGLIMGNTASISAICSIFAALSCALIVSWRNTAPLLVGMLGVSLSFGFLLRLSQDQKVGQA